MAMQLSRNFWRWAAADPRPAIQAFLALRFRLTALIPFPGFNNSSISSLPLIRTRIINHRPSKCLPLLFCAGSNMCF